MFAVPFFPLSITEKASLAGAFFILAEILFWVGVLIAGKDFVSRFTGYLKPSAWRQFFNKEQTTNSIESNGENASHNTPYVSTIEATTEINTEIKSESSAKKGINDESDLRG